LAAGLILGLAVWVTDGLATGLAAGRAAIGLARTTGACFAVAAFLAGTGFLATGFLDAVFLAWVAFTDGFFAAID
jgi:hypothetical protein